MQIARMGYSGENVTAFTRNRERRYPLYPFSPFFTFAGICCILDEQESES